MSTELIATKRILICDDDRDILDVLNMLLTQAGFEVLLANSHHELFNHFESGSPHLVLLDIRMPESDGFLTAETLRRRGHSVPIIFMSAHDNPFSRIYSSSVGASGYFKKPFDSGELLAKIQSVLSSS